MKKTLVLAIVFGLSVLYAPLVSAATVGSSDQYTVSVGGTINLTSAGDVKLTLNNIDSRALQTYPPQEKKSARISIVTTGGCKNPVAPQSTTNTNTTVQSQANGSASGSSVSGSISVSASIAPLPPQPCTVDGSRIQDFSLGVNQTVQISSSLAIKAITITESTLTFQVLTGPIYDNKPPMSEDGSTVSSDGKTSPPFPPTGTTGQPGVSAGGGGTGSLMVCTADNPNCTVCSGDVCKKDALPVPGHTGTINRAGVESQAFMVPKGQEVQSVIKADAEANATTSIYLVKTKRNARLFFLIPVHPEITYSVDSNTNASVDVARPWWNFLAW